MCGLKSPLCTLPTQITLCPCGLVASGAQPALPVRICQRRRRVHGWCGVRLRNIKHSTRH